MAGAAIAAWAAMSGTGYAQNTSTVFNTGATDLSIGANYSTAITPTAAGTADVEFTGTYSTPALDVDGSALVFGTLNDMSTQALVITNTNTASGSITLSTAANSVSGTAADLLYVATGGNLTINGSAGTNALIIGTSGNINAVGTLNIVAPVTIAAGSTVTFTGAGTSTINGSIGSTTAGLVLNSAGSIILQGSNSYTGGTAYNTAGGFIRVTNNSALGTGAVTFNANGTLATNFQGPATTVSNGIVINSGATASFDGGYADLTLAGNISGAGSVKKVSSGNVIFSGSNSYTGGTSITAGYATFTSTAAIPSTGQITVSAGAAIVDTGAYSTVMGYLGSGSIASASAGSIALTANSSEAISFATYPSMSLSATGAVTYSGTLTPGSSGYKFSGPSAASSLTVSTNLTAATTLNASGSGKVTLTGSNTYTGLTTVSSGTLIVAPTGSFTGYTGGFTAASGSTLNISSGTINASAGAISAGGASLIVGANLSTTGALTLGSPGGGTVTVATGGLFSAGSIANSYQSNYVVNGTFNVSGAATMATNAINTISGTGTLNVASLALSNGTNLTDTLTTLNITGQLGLGSNGAIKTFNVGTGSLLTAGSVNNSYQYNLIDSGTMNVAANWQTAVASAVTWTGNGSLNVGSFNLANVSSITSTLGSFNVSGAVKIGDSAISSNSRGLFNQNGGVVNFTSASSNIVLGNNTTGTNFGGYNLAGGTLNVPNASLVVGNGTGIASVNITGGTANLYGVSFAGTGAATFNVAGGAVNIGAGGINSIASGTRAVSFGTVTVGSSRNWASNVAMTLNGTGTGTTFSTLDSVNGTTPRSIALNGAITGSGALNLTGPGSLFINGSLSSSNSLTMASGSTLGGSGTISCPVTIPDGGNLQAGYSGSGTLTVGSLTFAGASNVSIGTLASYASTPAINVQGGLTASGAAGSVIINVASLVGTTPGSTYVLAAYSGGAITGSNTAFTLATLPGGTQGMLSFPSGQIDLTLGGAYLYWTGANSGAWDTSTSNWASVNSSGGATASTYTDNVGNQVLFGDSVAGTPVTTTTVNLNSGIEHPAGVTFNNSSTNYVLQSSNGGGIGGSGGITLNGTGTVTLNTANTFTGGTLLNAGLLVIPADSALGMAPALPTTNITFNGGNLMFSGSTTLNANRSVALNSTSATIDVNSNAVAIPGTIGGVGSLVVQNTGQLASGVLTLGSSNTYSGGTSINGGATLNIASDGSLGAVPSTPSTNLTINASTLQAGASGISLSSSRQIELDGNTDTIDLNSNSLTINGQVTGSAALNVINTGNGSGGVLKLFATPNNSENGPLNILAGTVDIGATGSNYITTSQNFSIINVSAGATLVFTGTNTFGYSGAGTYKPPINVLGGTVTNGGADNYIGGQITMTGGTVNGTADFRLQAYNTVSTNAMVTTNAAATTATFTVPSLVMYSNTVFNVAQGTVAAGGPDLLIASNISGTPGLTLTGTGLLQLTGTNSYTGGTHISSGTLSFASPKAFPSFTNLTVTGGSAVAAAHNAAATGAAKNNLFVNSLSLAGGTGAWTGQVDLNNNDMIVQGSGNGTSVATITNMVAQGYNNGAWNGPGGITSTAAAHDSTHLTALGVILNDDGTGTALYGANSASQTPFDGVTTTVDGDVLVKFTYYGDTNLDGQVNSADYSRIDNAYLNNLAVANGSSGSPMLTGWFNGDFNYDNVINGSDYTLIDNAFNMQGAQLSTEIASPTAQIAGGASAVPEPTSLALLALGATGLLGRRRRR